MTLAATGDQDGVEAPGAIPSPTSPRRPARPGLMPQYCNPSFESAARLNGSPQRRLPSPSILIPSDADTGT
jgi:hypothetical protein